MSNAWTIMKRELHSGFLSPIAYVVIAGFLVIAGFFFYSYLVQFSEYCSIVTHAYTGEYDEFVNELNINDFVLAHFFGSMTIVLLFFVPFLTMRLFAEERKQKTDELLFTSPVTSLEILAGKYLAGLGYVAAMLAPTGLLVGLTFLYSNPDVGPVLTGYLGVFLTGAAFVAVGLFASSTTQNQIVAAALSFAILLLFWLIGFISESVGAGTGAVLAYLSITEHFQTFIKGLVDTRDLVFFLSFVTFSLFLTHRMLEVRTWR